MGVTARRDCGNCAHSAPRHGNLWSTADLVCMIHAKAVRGDQFARNLKVPCGSEFDVRFGAVPADWEEITDNCCEIDIHDTGWAVCEECGATWCYDRPFVYNYCPKCGRRIRK